MTLYDALKETNSPRSIYKDAIGQLTAETGGDVTYAFIGHLRVISKGGVFAVPAAVFACLSDKVIIADTSAPLRRFYELARADISEAAVNRARLEIRAGETTYSIKCAFDTAEQAAEAVKRMIAEPEIPAPADTTEAAEPDSDERGKTFDFPYTDENGYHYIQEFTTYVSGTMQYYGDTYSQSVIRELEEGENVYLERDADNTYDPFAIRILDYEGTQFGWIPYADYGDSAMQFDLCQFLKDGAHIIARVKRVYTRRDKSLGVMIDIRVY